MSNKFSQFKIQDIFDRDLDKFEPHPHRAWAVIFFAEVVLIMLVLVSHVYLYVYMHTDSSFKPNDSSLGINEVKLNRKGLVVVTAMFEARNARFQDLLASPPKITDPSEGVGGTAPESQSVLVSPQKKILPKTATSSTSTLL